MSEIEKMRNGELADCSDPEIQASFKRAKSLLAQMRTMSTYDKGYRMLLEQLIPSIPQTSTILPPFHCDHGHGIIMGHHVFVNAGCTFLDGAFIRIGNYTLIGPSVQIYTPHHPLDYRERRQEKEFAYPVTIGDDCWIGGGVIVCPGVTIGDRAVDAPVVVDTIFDFLCQRIAVPSTLIVLHFITGCFQAGSRQDLSFAGLIERIG